MKADVADLGVLERRLPGALDDADRFAAKADEQSFWLAHLKEKREQSPGQGNLAGFSLWSFGARDEQDFLGEVNVFPPLARDLAPAHTCVESKDDHGVQMALGGRKQQLLLGDAQDLSVRTSLAGHSEAGERIGGDQLLVYGPIQQVPQHAQVPVDGRVLDGRVVLAPSLAELLGQRLGDPHDRNIRKERQQEPGVIEMMRADGSA